MSELIKCKTCEKPLSSTASVCPHCGEEYSIKKKQKNKSFHPITKIFIIVTVILLARQFLFPEKNTTGGYKDNTSSSNSFLPASGNLWTGVKIYYANNNDEICWREAEALAKLELEQYEMKEPWHDLIVTQCFPHFPLIVS